MTSDIVEMLKKHEGLKLELYRDTVGKPTIGYGRNLADVGISQAEAELMLKNDIEVTRQWVIRDIPCFGGLSGNRQNVILDMAFNLRGNLLKFHDFLAYLTAGKYPEAKAAMLDSVWAKQVGARATELADMLVAG